MRKFALVLAAAVMMAGAAGCAVHRPKSHCGVDGCGSGCNGACNGACDGDCDDGHVNCKPALFHGSQCRYGECGPNDPGDPAGPPTGAVTYPYYTTRGPRDFLANNPPGVGP